MSTYNRSLYDDFFVNASRVCSYSALSKRVYLSDYYDKQKCRIPVISGHLESVIREAYYGGIVDVVRHIVKRAFKYDSNSHYPAAMVNDMPVGTPRLTDLKDLDKIFGFCRVEVEAPTEDVLLQPILP